MSLAGENDGLHHQNMTALRRQTMIWRKLLR
jgi:hypothetical protein